MSYNPLYDPFAPLTASTTPSPHVSQAAAAVTNAGGWLTHFIEHPGSPLPLEIGVIALGGGLFVWAKAKGPGTSADPNKGFASRRDLKKSISEKAIRSKIHVLRPTKYDEISNSDRRRVDPREGGHPLGRTVVGAKGVAVYAPHEHVTVVEAPPRIGKTAILAGVVIDAPGPTVVTSVRPDIVQHTAALRAARGGKPLLFDPEGLSGLPGTVKIDLVAGCENPEIAIETAGYLLSGTNGAEGVTNRSFWEGAAFEVLRSFLHAAALGGKNLMDVWRWAQGGSSAEAAQILRYNENASEGWATALEFTLKEGKDGQTRDSILKTLSLALGFMANPTVARTVTPAPGEGFDIDAFLNSQADTLYMLARDRPHSSTAPVFTGFLGRLVERGLTTSGRYKGGRLDPILTLALDEACNISPVPLERWTTSAGGSGISIVFVIQSKSQLVDRYGTATAETIMSGATVKIVLGGMDDEDRLRQISTRCGQYWDVEENHTANPQGGTSTHRKKVRRDTLTPAEISMIPENQALVIYSNGKPTIVQFVPVWQRKDTKQYAKVDVAALLASYAPRPATSAPTVPAQPQYAAPAPVAGFQAFQNPEPVAEPSDAGQGPESGSDALLRPRPVNPWENR